MTSRRPSFGIATAHRFFETGPVEEFTQHDRPYPTTYREGGGDRPPQQQRGEGPYQCRLTLIVGAANCLKASIDSFLPSLMPIVVIDRGTDPA